MFLALSVDTNQKELYIYKKSMEEQKLFASIFIGIELEHSFDIEELYEDDETKGKFGEEKDPVGIRLVMQNGEGNAIIYKIRDEKIEILEPPSKKDTPKGELYKKSKIEIVKFNIAGPMDVK